MTTDVKVASPQYASWLVEVSAMDVYPAGSLPRFSVLATLKPGESHTAYCTDTRSILTREIPIPPTPKGA